MAGSGEAWARAAWPAMTGTAAAASVTLALLVLACTFVAVAVPRASLGYRTAVLQRVFHTAPASQKAAPADGDLSGLGAQPLSPALLETARAQLAIGLRQDGLPLAPARTQWSGLATGTTPLSGATAPALRRMLPPVMELLFRNGLASRSVLTAGSMPTAVTSHGIHDTFQVAVTTGTAARLGVHVGSRLRTAGETLLVTGIVRPVDPASDFWSIDPIAFTPQLTQLGIDATPFWTAGAFVGPAEADEMQRQLSTEPLHSVWSFPLDLSAVTADQAASLQRKLQATSYLPVASLVSSSLTITGSEGGPFVVSLGTGLTVDPALVRGDRAMPCSGPCRCCTSAWP